MHDNRTFYRMVAWLGDNVSEKRGKGRDLEVVWSKPPAYGVGYLQDWLLRDGQGRLVLGGIPMRSLVTR